MKRTPVQKQVADLAKARQEQREKEEREERERTEPYLKEQRVSEEKKVSWEADLEEECPSSARSSSSSN